MRMIGRHVSATEERPPHHETLFRRLTLRHNGEVFLDRFGIGTQWFGLYLHRIVAPDPGIDLHDHPWPFVSLILWGGYTEEVAEARDAPALAKLAEHNEVIREVVTGQRRSSQRGDEREWRCGSVHRMPLTIAHRITAVEPHTWTLVLRGRKSRSWGFYLPAGYVDQRAYDYKARRPVAEQRDGTVA